VFVGLGVLVGGIGEAVWVAVIVGVSSGVGVIVAVSVAGCSVSVWVSVVPAIEEQEMIDRINAIRANQQAGKIFLAIVRSFMWGGILHNSVDLIKAGNAWDDLRKGLAAMREEEG
jgi:hypothetical protein